MNMSMFYQEEVRGDPSKRGKYCVVASALKNAFSKCHSSRGGKQQPQEPTTDFDQQHEELVSEVMSKYMESKSKRESSNIGINSLCNFLSLSMEYFINIDYDEDEFVSAGTHISIPPSDDFDDDDDDDTAFISAKTCFSRCSSSLSNIDFKDMKTRSIILEFIHCEGWPFGLCRKALLLPPLPKSPADSWSWNKSAKITKIHE